MGYSKRTVSFKLADGNMEKITGVDIYVPMTKLPSPSDQEDKEDKIWGTEGFWTKYENGYEQNEPITVKLTKETVKKDGKETEVTGFDLTFHANCNKRQGVSNRYNMLRNNSRSPVAGDYGKDFDKRLDYACFITIFIKGLFRVSKDRTEEKTVVLSDFLIGQTEKDWYVSGPKLDGEHFHFLFWQESFVGQVCLIASSLTNAKKNEYTLAPGAAMVAIGEIDKKEDFNLYISKF